MLGVLDAVVLHHDSRLLALAVVICSILAFSAVSLLARVRLIEAQTHIVWYGAALLLGCGLWALHFAALIGFAAAVPISFDLGRTMAAMAVAVAGTMVALGAYLADRGHRRGAIAAGVLLGASLVGTQYVSVAAMRPAGAAVLDGSTPLVPALIAVAFSILFFIRSSSANTALRQIEASLYLIAALVGVYVFAMSDLSIVAGPEEPVLGSEIGSNALSIALGATGFVVLGLSLAGDVLERHVLQRVQQESGRLLQLVGAAFEGIVIHRDGVIIETNEAFRRLGGWTEEALHDRRLADFVAGEDTSELDRRLRQSDDTTPVLSFSLLAKDGHTIPVEVVSRAIEYEGAPAYVAGVRDLSSRVRAEERIRHLAHHDSLTDLPNRFLLTDRLAQAISLAKRNNTIVVVFYLDLDRFKAVNDVLGHEAGDEVLIEVGQRLLKTLRSSDTLARLGGDEFVIVQPLVQHAHEAASLARRVVEALSVPFEINGQMAEIGVSIGIAIFPQDGEAAAELMHNADTAMYRAKEEGHGTYLFFEPAMDHQIQERRHLEHDLRQALAHEGELEVYYQPLFVCDDAMVTGFEALVRWRHPTRGMIPPSEFVPLAEECGLINALGKWVLEQACAEAAKWPKTYRVAVNLSPAQFRQPDLTEMVAETLRRTGLAPERLELEITEGVLIDSTDRALEVLTELKAQRINISLDDFGTGYSSLSYLRRFPFDKIKIDRSFVNGLGESDEAAAIVRAIVALGQSLRLSITAEGVETEDQLSALRTLECNHVQGFLLGRPMPNNHLTDLLESGVTQENVSRPSSPAAQDTEADTPRTPTSSDAPPTS